VLATDPVLLETVWEAISRHLDRDAFHEQERRTVETVGRLAREVSLPQIASPEAFARAGCGDALPALRRLIALMASGLLRHAVLSMAVAAAVEHHPASAA
jgi:hypothetical protein